VFQSDDNILEDSNRSRGALTIWRPLLLYGYSCKASCARPG